MWALRTRHDDETIGFYTLEKSPLGHQDASSTWISKGRNEPKYGRTASLMDTRSCIKESKNEDAHINTRTFMSMKAARAARGGQYGGPGPRGARDPGGPGRALEIAGNKRKKVERKKNKISLEKNEKLKKNIILIKSMLVYLQIIYCLRFGPFHSRIYLNLNNFKEYFYE